MQTARVLIIDESSVVRQLAQNTVEEFGLLAQTVADYTQALEKLQTRQFDLVLIEIKEPEEQAIDNLRMLKAGMNELYTAPVPIVAMVSGIAREQVLTAGANDVMNRPFMPKELEAVLDRWLSA